MGVGSSYSLALGVDQTVSSQRNLEVEFLVEIST